jgi:hypothetical protein
MANLGKVVYLTDTQYNTLVTNGTITVGQTTITYSDNDLYVTPAETGTVYVSGNTAYVVDVSTVGQVTVVTPASGTTFTLAPCPVTYSFGEKAELTLTVNATSQYHFMFSCPSSAATVLTITGETMRCGDELEAGETYEVDIWAGITKVAKVEGTAVT